MRLPDAATCSLILALAVNAQTPPTNVTLLSELSNGTAEYSGIWGMTAADGREFAIVGAFNGTWVVDITNPQAPVSIVTVPTLVGGGANHWREVTCYGTTAYSVTEAHGGVHVIDMSVPSAPRDLGAVHRTTWAATHTISVDVLTGRLYANGTNKGQYVLDAAANPLAPPILGVNTVSYVHDCYVRGGRAYLAEFPRFRIADVAALPFTAVYAGYTPQRAEHNTWVTDDAKLLFITNEISNGATHAYDISTPTNPVLLGSYSTITTPATLTHNVVGIGRTLYIAHNAEGFHMVDGSDPSKGMKRLANYDTTTATALYSGVWGVYPHADSGVVCVSDRVRGLMLLQVECGHLHRYGAGTAGGNGVPRAQFEGGAMMVNSAKCRLEISRLPPNAPFALVLGTASASLQVLNITVHVALKGAWIVSGTASAEGKVAIPLPVPDDPRLANGKLYAQVIAIDGNQLIASRGMWFGICP